jgi:hypothetical protein
MFLHLPLRLILQEPWHVAVCRSSVAPTLTNPRVARSDSTMLTVQAGEPLEVVPAGAAGAAGKRPHGPHHMEYIVDGYSGPDAAPSPVPVHEWLPAQVKGATATIVLAQGTWALRVRSRVGSVLSTPSDRYTVIVSLAGEGCSAMW